MFTVMTMRNVKRYARLIGLYIAKVTQVPADSDEDDKLFGTRKFTAE